MVVQLLLGAWLARKLFKAIEHETDLRRLQEFGKENGVPFVPGENIEEYRKRLIAARNQKIDALGATV